MLKFPPELFVLNKCEHKAGRGRSTMAMIIVALTLRWKNRPLAGPALTVDDDAPEKSQFSLIVSLLSITAAGWPVVGNSLSRNSATGSVVQKASRL